MPLCDVIIIEKVNNMDLKINYVFKNEKLLQVALTHSSFAHEAKSNIINNERFEFLGDAVLELIISSFIFDQFPELPEGELTKFRASIVCETTLAKIARELNLGEFLKLGKGEEHTGGRNRDSILADAMEAVFGAVYLDSGIEGAKKFIIELMKNSIFDLRKSFKLNDCKTYLQEIIQSKSKSSLKYNIVKESGPAHDKVFVIEVSHCGKILGRGLGKNKKEAEQNAAFDAIKKIENQQ